MNYLYLALLLVLPVSALLARRIPIGRAAVIGLAWVGIFAVALVIAALVDRNDSLKLGVRQLFYPDGQTVTGREVRIAMAEDGHFYAQATINGVARTLLIDSGATFTSLSSATAAAAGLDTNEDPIPEVIRTANGTVEARRATVKMLDVGGAIAARDLPVVVAPAFEDDVIGMNFLSRLATWRVEGRTLILSPKPS